MQQVQENPLRFLCVPANMLGVSHVELPTTRNGVSDRSPVCNTGSSIVCLHNRYCLRPPSAGAAPSYICNTMAVP